MFACAVIAALPGSADADVTLSNGFMGQVVVTSDAESDVVPITYDADTFNVTIDDGDSVYCQEPVVYPGPAECSYTSVFQLFVDLGEGDDRSRVFASGDFAWPAGKELFMAGQEGDDKLTGGEGKDHFYGGTGKDKIIADDGKKDQTIWCGKGDDPSAKIDDKDPEPKSC